MRLAIHWKASALIRSEIYKKYSPGIGNSKAFPTDLPIRRERFRTISNLLPLVLSILFLMPGLSYAQEARIADITITNTHDDLELAYLSVKNTFTKKMREIVASGVPATFSFFITLHKVRHFWVDKEIARIEITHKIKYHNLKKEFVIRRSWEKDTRRVTHSFKEARKLMNEIRHLKIVPLRKLKKDTRYRLRAKVELSKLRLPLYLHHLLVLVSLWNFETDWYDMDFVY